MNVIRGHGRGREDDVGRIVVPVHIENAMERTYSITCEALVDTGAWMMTLPSAWRERLGALETNAYVELSTATQETVVGEVCGPVHLRLQGFRAIATEVLFIDMGTDESEYKPLVGYITLEQSQAVVDMVHHQLARTRYADLKNVGPSQTGAGVDSPPARAAT